MKKLFLLFTMAIVMLMSTACDSWKEITASTVAGGITTVIAPRTACTTDEASAINADLRSRILAFSWLKKNDVKKFLRNKGIGSTLCKVIVTEALDLGVNELPPIYTCAGNFVGNGLNELAAKVCEKIKI